MGLVDENAFRVHEVRRSNLVANGVGVLNPGDKRDRNAVDMEYDSAIDYMIERELSAPEANQFNLQFVADRGIVPTALKNTIEGGMNSPIPSKQAAAARSLRELGNVHSQVLSQFSEKAISEAAEINALLDAGATEEQVFEIRKEARNVSADVRKSRGSQWRELSKPEDTTAFLSEQFNPFGPTGAPDIPPEMATQFRRVEQNLYSTHGNLDAARAGAFGILRRKWGVSELNGNRSLMANPPELVYGSPQLSVEENASWQRRQLLSELSEDTIGGEPIDPEKLIIRPNARVTAADGRPVYVVSLITDRSVEVLSEAQVFDYSQTEEYAAEKEQAQELLMAADRGELMAKLTAAKQKAQGRRNPLAGGSPSVLSVARSQNANAQ
jgi:hypothetical protein